MAFTTSQRVTNNLSLRQEHRYLVSKQSRILCPGKTYCYEGILDSRDCKARDSYFRIDPRDRADGRWIDKTLRANIVLSVYRQSWNDRVGLKGCVEIQASRSRRRVVAGFGSRL